MRHLSNIVGQWRYFSYSLNTPQTTLESWRIQGLGGGTGFTVHAVQMWVRGAASSPASSAEGGSYGYGLRIGQGGFMGFETPTDELNYVVWKRGSYHVPYYNWTTDQPTSASQWVTVNDSTETDLVAHGTTSDSVYVLGQMGYVPYAAGYDRHLQVEGRFYYSSY